MSSRPTLPAARSVIKASIKTLAHAALRRPPLERLLAGAYRLSPRATRRYVRALVPPVWRYAPDEQRTAVRSGLRWELAPSAFFQWWYYFGFADPVLDVLRAFARGCRVIVDVGANVGVYSLVMASTAGGGAAVHAFEPHPATYRRLMRHRELNGALGVVGHQLACGAASGAARLFVDARGDAGKSSLRRGEFAVVDAGIDVRVVSLDEIVVALGWEHLDLLKIDVEGYEPEVLVGARRAIERFRPVLCVEVTPYRYRSAGDQVRVVLDVLGDAGYRYFSIALPEAPGPLLTPVDLPALLASETHDLDNVLAVPAGRELPSELKRALVAANDDLG